MDPVMLDKEMSIEQMLEFYMGKNTPDRQKFIIENLKVEMDTLEEEVFIKCFFLISHSK